MNLTKDQLIAALRDDLSNMIDWAREVSDEYLDSDPDVRQQYLRDMKQASDTLKLKAENKNPVDQSGERG